VLTWCAGAAISPFSNGASYNGYSSVQEKITFQNREWNQTSVDKIKELGQVADMAFKSQQWMTEMPSKDTDVDAFMEWTDQIHRILKPIL